MSVVTGVGYLAFGFLCGFWTCYIMRLIPKG